MSSRTTLLQGEPGSGKTKMICETAKHKPVHVVDVDRKIASAGWAAALIERNELTYWELREPVDESNIKSRMGSLLKGEKPERMPHGLSAFADYMYKVFETPEGKACGTLAVDSATMLGEHAKTHIMYLANRSKLQFDQWAALKSWWLDTVSFVIDLCKENDKDLMLTVHERPGEVPGPRTRGIKYDVDEKGNKVRTYVGELEPKVWSSIDGQTGQNLGIPFDEYYRLYVELDSEKRPIWKCRVHPDGLRSLRTSFTHKDPIVEPDFRKIWR